MIENEILNPKNKSQKKKIILVLSLALLSYFLYVQYRNFTGYCHAEGRYLTEEELIQRAAGKAYEENKDCCYLTERSMRSRLSSTPVDRFLFKLSGMYSQGITIYSKRETPLSHDLDYPYYVSRDSVTACGKNVRGFGKSIKEQAYLDGINLAKQVKKEKR